MWSAVSGFTEGAVSAAQAALTTVYMSRRHDANGAVIRWCFADAELAMAFAGEFN
jgi:hypothetical protein